MPVWYFAYGSNLDQEGMKKRVGSWREIRPAVLKGYRLVFNVYSSSWRGGVANVVEDPDSSVYGAVYLLEESQLEKLDRYEGVPHLYHRRKVLVDVGGSQVEAYIYVGTNPRQRIIASTEYVALLVKGLRRLGFGEDVVNMVKSSAERQK
ncbi:MAG: gamma-glutamylcyclotransferase family protein [Candidatus Caldarchaeum sp.]|nr:gamma-glutamylcyclotransferase family protein [Candidatus Caldarchaeum sp.]